METVDKIRSKLIDKILTITDKNLLAELDGLVSSSSINTERLGLTDEQKKMLELSEADIHKGQLISQEAMDKRNLEWLNGL